MRDCLKWKMHCFAHSLLLPILLVAGLLCGMSFILLSHEDGFASGIEFMRASVSFSSSFLVLAAGVFCAMSINRSVVSRQVSVCVMSGASRASVIFVECLFYILPLTIFVLVSSLVSFVAGSIVSGSLGITSIASAFFELTWLLVSLLVIASCFCVCVPLALLMKREGGCAAVCLLANLELYSMMQSLFQTETPNEGLIKLASFTSFGQLFLFPVCDSLSGVITAFVVSFLTLALFFTLDFIIFRRMELK